ncbi:MAG: hypothetical protein WCI18_11885 [Pseudomonadota bacterium]
MLVVFKESDNSGNFKKIDLTLQKRNYWIDSFRNFVVVGGFLSFTEIEHRIPKESLYIFVRIKVSQKHSPNFRPCLGTDMGIDAAYLASFGNETCVMPCN